MLGQMALDDFRALIDGLSLVSISSLREDLKRLPPGPNHDELIAAAQERIEELAAAEPFSGYDSVRPMWFSFCENVNASNLSVLEVGSRVGPDETPAKKPLFHGASEYVGFDFHDGPNVDIVGDVHQLSNVLNGKRFDAICSHSVLEHVAMPWVAAVEMVKSLNVGGIMFHHVPFSFPMHELPWDFWRFTPEAYKVLFPSRFGVNVEQIGCEFPLRLSFDESVPGQESFSLQRSFGFTGAVIRKIADVDLSEFKWDMALPDLLGAESVYPTKSA